jgi:replicative DNA helicase
VLHTPWMLFVASLFEEGKEGLLQAMRAGVTPEHLFDDTAASVFGYLVEYYMRYDGVPARDIVHAETSVYIPNAPNEPLDFWIDKVCEMRQHRALLQVQKDLTKLLERQQTQEALTLLEGSSIDVRLLGREHRRTRSMGELVQDIAVRYRRIKSGERGVPTPWKTINEATLGMWPQDIVAFVARPGIGKCLAEDTEMVDPITGVPMTLREMFEDPSRNHVFSWSKEEGVHVRPITAKVDTGYKQCLTFTLKTGRQITVTPEHPFLTSEGWVRADQISEGITVALTAKTPEPVEPQPMSDEDVDLLGQEVAHGSSTDTRIPDRVYRLPNTQLARFLGAFWRGAGYVDQEGVPRVTLASERRVRQIQHLLLRFGIQSGVCYKLAEVEEKSANAWALRVYAQSLEKFYRHIPMSGEKGARLKRHFNRSTDPDSGYPSVTSAFMEEVYSVIEEGKARGICLSDVGAHQDLFDPETKRLRGCFKGFCEVYGVEDRYSWLWDSGAFWDSVESIEYAGTRKIYDLTVRPTSCFVANDVIVHNTWLLSLIALHAQREKKRVLFATTEMSDEEIALRYWSLREKWPFEKLWRGALDPEHEKRFFELVETGEHGFKAPFDVVSGDFNITPASILAAIDDVKPDVLVIDGAYLLKAFGRTRNERHAEAFEEIKRIAKKANIPIVIASQLNRDAEKEKNARLGQVAFSDALAQVASYVFFLENTEDNDRKLIIPAKTRHVRISPFEIYWQFDTMNFLEAVRLSQDPSDDEQFLSLDSEDIPF